MDMRVSDLIIFPVKSCGPIHVNSFELGRFGPQGDRRWMLVEADSGQFISQRQCPRMTLIQVSQTDTGIEIAAPGCAPLMVSEPVSGPHKDVTVWGDSVASLDAGEAAAKWFGDFLERPCRLVYMPDDSSRAVDRDFASAGQQVGFADGFPLLLISEASLEALNERLDQAVEMLRFRPNIVVSGCDAFAEDQWKSIRIGDCVFKVAKPCARCVIPSIDPRSGDKTPGFSRALASFRRRDGEVFFGQNLLYEDFSTISVGDCLTVIDS